MCAVHIPCSSHKGTRLVHMVKSTWSILFRRRPFEMVNNTIFDFVYVDGVPQLHLQIKMVMVHQATPEPIDQPCSTHGARWSNSRPKLRDQVKTDQHRDALKASAPGLEHGYRMTTCEKSMNFQIIEAKHQNMISPCCKNITHGPVDPNVPLIWN